MLVGQVDLLSCPSHLVLHYVTRVYLMSQACEALLLLLTANVQRRSSNSASQIDLQLAFEIPLSDYFLLSMSLVVAVILLSGFIMGFDAGPHLFLACLVATADQLHLPTFHKSSCKLQLSLLPVLITLQVCHKFVFKSCCAADPQFFVPDQAIKDD